MKISIIADELSSDLETALELVRMWGVSDVELRRAGNRRYPDVDDYWKARVPDLVHEFGMNVIAISPGLFKIPFPGEAEPIHFQRAADMTQWKAETDAQALVDYHADKLLPMSIEAAKQLGAEKIICFDFEWEGHVAPEGAIQILRHAAKLSGEAGIDLVIEVDLHTSADTAEFVRRVNHPALGINWDPGNGYRIGDEVPYPDCYEMLKPYIRHVHVKNCRVDERGRRVWGLTDDGAVDWRAAIKALKRDGYTGYFSTEPHYRPKIESTRRTLDMLRTYIAEA